MSLKESQSYEDRRDSIRAKRIVTVRYRLVKHKGRKTTRPWQVSVTENMSLSGLLFISVTPYEKGDVIELQVVMSGVLDIFNGYGEVVRTTQNKGSHYYVAIKYTDLKANTKIKTKTRSAKRL